MLQQDQGALEIFTDAQTLAVYDLDICDDVVAVVIVQVVFIIAILEV